MSFCYFEAIYQLRSKQLFKLTCLSIAAVVVLAGCEQKAVPLEKVMPAPTIKPSKVKDLVLSPQAIGRVTFGVPLAQVETILGEQAMGLDQTDNPECSYVAFKALPKVRLMIEKGIVTRADVDPDIANITGVRVGDTEAVARQKAPNATIGPHKYVPKGHVFTVAGSADTAIIMESDGSTITRIRAGKQPAVAYVEGCG